jgi:hypothetical protein
MEILPFSDKNIMQKNIPWMQAKKIREKQIIDMKSGMN